MLEAKIMVPLLPGKNTVSSFIDMGRSVIVRARLRVVELQESGFLKHPGVPDYLERLQSFLVASAQHAEAVDSATGTL